MRTTRNHAPVPGLVILDIDGTLLDTPHLAAWQQGVSLILAEHRGPRSAADFVLAQRDYQRDIAGRPREVGAAAALEIAGLEATERLIGRLVRDKQEIFREMAPQITLFADARRFLDRAAELRAPIAFCTASRNASGLLREVLSGHQRQNWLLGRVDRSLGPDGHRGARKRTDALRQVALAWDVRPCDCLVIDDAWHGVTSAVECGMAAVLVDRFGHGSQGDVGQREVSSLEELRAELRPGPDAAAIPVLTLWETTP